MPRFVVCCLFLLLFFICLRLWMRRRNDRKELLRRRRGKDRDLSHYPYRCRIYVDGMTGNHCRKKVENTFNEWKDVYAVVDFRKRQAVIYMKVQIPEYSIKMALRRIGYRPGAFSKNY